MPIDTIHPIIRQRMTEWEKCRDCKGGEDVIKAAKEKYTPKLGGHDANEYANYVNRGSFYNATARTVQGLTGAIMRKEPKLEEAGALKDVLDHITLDGLSFNAVAGRTVESVLSYAYFGILVDMPDRGGVPYWTLYEPFSIVSASEIKIGNVKKLSGMILEESIEEPSAADKYEIKSKTQIRELYLDEKGLLACRIWTKEREKWVFVDQVEPRNKGKRLDFIPFVPFGPMVNLPLPHDKPPILDLVNINLAHWRTDVDYRHGLHWCALPTLYALGLDKDEKLAVGGGKVIRSSNENAKVGMVEFTGQGLGAIVTSLERFEKQMAILGARLLEGQRAGVEAAETARIRQSGEAATLKTIAEATGDGLSTALRYTAFWMGAPNAKPRASMNKDFISETMSAPELVALLQARQAGEISRDTFLYNLMMGEILPEGRTIEEEKDLIETEAPASEPGQGGKLFGKDNEGASEE